MKVNGIMPKSVDKMKLLSGILVRPAPSVSVVFFTIQASFTIHRQVEKSVHSLDL